MLLYLIRHGETEFNKDRRYQGYLDISLSEEGKEKLRKADFEPELVYVSTLKRTAETARIIFPGARLKAVEGINERNFGIFEGRTAEEMKDDPEYRKWIAENCMTKCPEGESKDELARRACPALEAILRECAEEERKEAVIVTHGGLIMTVLEKYGYPRRDIFGWLPGNGCGYLFEYDPSEKEVKLNFQHEIAYAEDFIEMKILY